MGLHEGRAAFHFLGFPGEMLGTVLVGDPRSAGRPTLAQVDGQTQPKPLRCGAGERQHVHPLVGEVTELTMAETLQIGAVHSVERRPTPATEGDDAQLRAGDARSGHLFQLPRNLLARDDAVPPEPIDPRACLTRGLGKALTQRGQVVGPIREHVRQRRRGA